MATVEAGVTLGRRSRRTWRRTARCWRSIRRAAARAAWAASLATHASGPLRFRYGTGRDLLLGVRFVQADGTLTWGGAKVVKSVTGYDVPKLLVGSLGTLGVIVEATLRLHPMPPATRSWRLGLPSREAAAAFLAALARLAAPARSRRAARRARRLRRAGLTADPIGAPPLDRQRGRGGGAPGRGAGRGSRAGPRRPRRRRAPTRRGPASARRSTAPVLLRAGRRAAAPARLGRRGATRRPPRAGRRGGAPRRSRAHGVLQMRGPGRLRTPAASARDLRAAAAARRSRPRAAAWSSSGRRSSLRASCDVVGAYPAGNTGDHEADQGRVRPRGHASIPGRFVGGL